MMYGSFRVEDSGMDEKQRARRSSFNGGAAKMDAPGLGAMLHYCGCNR